MNTLFPSLSLLAVLLGYQAAAYAGTLHKVWERNLGPQIVRTGGDGVQPAILGLRFSPDGKKIAVAADSSRLLVMDVGNPKSDMREFAVADILSDSTPSAVFTPTISWSPAGDLIVAGGNLSRLRDGSSCSIGDTTGQAFVSADRLVAQVPSKKNSPQTLWQKLFEKDSLKLELFDTNCKSVGTWESEYRWTLADASPQSGLLAMLLKNHDDTGRFDELLVVDPLARKIVRTWSSIESAFTARFAADGTTVCTGDDAEDLYEDTRVLPRCEDIHTGEVIAAAGGVDGGAPLVTAEHGHRAIVSDYNHTWNLSYREYDTTFKRKVVWDFRKNEEVASWRPETQSHGAPGSKPPKDAFAYAISPDGEYVAEGGMGILTLYKIVP